MASTAGGVVVAGGLVRGDLSTRASYLVRLPDGHVTSLPRLVVAVHDAAGVSLDGTPLVVGGGNATEQATVQALGRIRNWHVRTELPAPRADLAAVSVANRLLVVGGYDGVGETANLLVSGGDHGFRPLGRLAVPVRYPSVVVWRGDVWVLGGERQGHMVAAVQRIEMPTGRCRVVGRLSAPIGHAAAVGIGGRILLMGGRTGPDAVTAKMQWFDPRTGSTHAAGHLPYPLADTAVASTRRGTYLLGGETPRLTDRVIEVSAE